MAATSSAELRATIFLQGAAAAAPGSANAAVTTAPAVRGWKRKRTPRKRGSERRLFRNPGGLLFQAAPVQLFEGQRRQALPPPGEGARGLGEGRPPLRLVPLDRRRV